MKQTFFTVLIFLTFLSCEWKKEDSKAINITGVITSIVMNKDSINKIIIRKQLLPKRKYVIIDSITPEADGSFKIKNLIKESGYYQLAYKGTNATANTLLFCDLNVASEIQIIIDTISYLNGAIKARKITVDGSEDNKILDGFFELSAYYYREIKTPLKKKINDLIAIKEESFYKSKKIDSLNTLLKYYSEEEAMKLNDYVINKMGTSISIFQTMNVWNEDNLKLVDVITERFKREKPNSFITPMIIEKGNELKEGVLVGKPVMNFTLNDKDLKPITIKDFIGRKVILIDFWASWCGPCLKEMPAYTSIYEKYKNKGFEIFSISTDKEREVWKKTMSKMSISGVKLIDTPGKESVAQQYKVAFLPTNFLINFKGEIIRKDISKADLERYLEENL